MTIQALLERMDPILDQVRQTAGAALPRLAIAVIALLGGYFLARLLHMMSRRSTMALARRVSRESVVARSVGDWEATSNVVARGVFWLTILSATMVATEALGLPVLATFTKAMASYAPRVVLSLLVIFIGVTLARFAGEALDQATRGLGQARARRLASGARALVGTGAALIAVEQLGVDVSLVTTALLIVLTTSLSGAALAFGIGVRGEMANVLAMRGVHQHYHPGQYIRVGHHEGKILRTSATVVFLESAEGEVAIPASLFAESCCVRLHQSPGDA